MSKIAIITYRVFEGFYAIPPGYYKKNNNLVIFSGDYGKSLYSNTPIFRDQEGDFDEAYVYCGYDHDGEALISFLLKAGKRVRIVSCGCNAMEWVVKELSLPFFRCRCSEDDITYFLRLIKKP